MANHILVVDDEVGIRELLFEILNDEGYRVQLAANAMEARAMRQEERPDLILLDIWMPEMDGITLLKEWGAAGQLNMPVVMMSGHGTVDQAVRLLKRGAVDYLLKPFAPDLLLGKLKTLLTRQDSGHSDVDVLGISPAMRALEDLLSRLAQSQASVLITGESGVGKERVALKLHALQGAGRPFVASNCGAYTESLLEAELFGHEKGAFTGALRVKRGLFEQAMGGTLLLDEIGDMPLSMQVKVLRAIQERQITRIGGEGPIAVDFRLIAATHQDLKARVEQGLFREDLYYRVNVIQLRVPPLRERQEDILWLAGHFLEQAALTGDGRRLVLAPKAERALLDHTWPGNVRELKHLLERARVLATGPVLTPESLFGDTAPSKPPVGTLSDYLAGHERDYILRALLSQAWQIQETANLLGISRKNLWEKMKRLEIRRAAEE